MYTIPLSTSPRQSFKVNIPVDGENKYFEFNLLYNKQGNYWMLTIRDGKTRDVIISNINVLPTFGPVNSNILYAYKYLRIGSAYVVPMIKQGITMPDDKNLGTDYVLVWGDTD